MKAKCKCENISKFSFYIIIKRMGNFNTLLLLWTHFTFPIHGMTWMNDEEDISRISFRVHGFEVPPLIYWLRFNVVNNYFFKS